MLGFRTSPLATSPAPTASTTGGGVGVRIVAGVERAAVGAAWRALEQRIGSTGLACSWDWTETWLDAYGDVAPHAFAVGEPADGGPPCGLALLVRGSGRSGAVRIRRLHVGTAGEPRPGGVNVEYNRLLAVEEARAGYARALVETVLGDPSWDELMLDGFAADEAEALLDALPAFEPQVRPSPYRDLRGGGDVLEALPAGTARRIRRSLRGFGAVETEWAEDAGPAGQILDELAQLHQLRWRGAGERGAFADERFRAFHHALVARLLPDRRAVLFRVRGAAGTIGCVYGFVERGRVLFYQSGFAAFEDNKLRPGLVTHLLCMQAAADRGLLAYDFLPGESRYKRELSTGEERLVWARARRPGLRARAVDAQRWIKRRARASGS
jgi:CelD/BcsL family acetyltransferase involved in cellulose biosynthesis